jgi:hypothetical protein
MIFSEPESLEESSDESDESELEFELDEVLSAAAGGSLTTTVNSTSEIGAPRSIPPVENYSTCFALIASSYA